MPAPVTYGLLRETVQTVGKYCAIHRPPQGGGFHEENWHRRDHLPTICDYDLKRAVRRDSFIIRVPRRGQRHASFPKA